MSNFINEFNKFSKDKLRMSMSDMEFYATKLCSGDEVEGEELFWETVYKLLDKNANKQLGHIADFVAYFKTALYHTFIDKVRKRPNVDYYENSDFRRFFDKSFKDEALEQRRIIIENIHYVLEHLECYDVFDSIKQRVFRYKFERLSFKKIVEILASEGKTKTINDLTVMNKRTRDKIEKAIRRKHPNFTSELISKNEDNEQ